MRNRTSRAVLALASAVALAACRSEPQRLQVWGHDIGPGFANVAVVLDGAPANDARVVVNGTAIPRREGAPGQYSGLLPAMLAPGDPLVLEVTKGPLRVTGTGAIPPRPFVVAAYTGALDPSEGDVVVTWTCPSDPGAFAVATSWSCGPDCGDGRWFWAAGSDRTLTIPAGMLPHGLAVEATVFAYNDGTFAGDYAPYPEYPGMNIRSESGRIQIATGHDGPPPATLEVRGQDIGDCGANVYVTQHGQGIEDAVVVANGQVLPPIPGEGGRYGADFPVCLASGSNVSLEVTHGDLQVVALGAIPEAPVVTSPSDVATLSAAEDVLVVWTSATDPDYFDVVANWSCGAWCGTGTQFEVPGSARALSIPAASLPTGAMEIEVFAYDDGTFGGDYTPSELYPGMNVREVSNGVRVTRN